MSVEIVATIFYSHARNMWTDHSACEPEFAPNCPGCCTVWLIGVYPDPATEDDDSARCPQCNEPCGNLFKLEWMYSGHDSTVTTCHRCMRILVGAEPPRPVPWCLDC